MFRRLTLLLLCALPPLVSCERDSEEETVSTSEDAKLQTVEALRQDSEAERHPSDGGGRARLASAPDVPPVVSSLQQFEIVYEAGPLGIEEGGAVYLQPSPFWGWDAPQTRLDEAPGYLEAATEASGVELDVSTPGGVAVAAIGGRKLEEGETLRFLYRTRVDRYAENDSPIWIAVDGDGDGVRPLLDDVPLVDVVAGRPARLVVTVPTTAQMGAGVRVTVAVVDSLGSAGVDFAGTIELGGVSGLELPATLELRAEDRGVRSVLALAREAGVYRVRASTGDGLLAESNPLIVRDGIPRILWGDLHGHSQFSDGTATPRDYYWYARHVAALDVVALTDHDHWGMRFLDQTPKMWEVVREAAAEFEKKDAFIALAGYEWTNWIHGHRHVLYFGEAGDVLSSIDPRYETPTQLWEALRGRDAITIAHHSAGGPISTNWDFVPDPELEPVTEIVSVHGVSEAWDSPARIYSPVEGNFVRDVLDRGVRFGFIGSGDSHDGHPGLAHLASSSGGLAAIFSEALTREGVLAALRARRVYATNGPRIWLRLWLDDHPMGSSLPPPAAATQELRFAVAATAPIERVDVIRSGEVVETLAGAGGREQSKRLEVPALESGDYIYVRVVQTDGGLAWSSPIYIE